MLHTNQALDDKKSILKVMDKVFRIGSQSPKDMPAGSVLSKSKIITTGKHFRGKNRNIVVNRKETIARHLLQTQRDSTETALLSERVSKPLNEDICSEAERHYLTPNYEPSDGRMYLGDGAHLAESYVYESTITTDSIKRPLLQLQEELEATP